VLRRALRAPLIALAAAGLVLAGCGGGDPTSDSEASASAAANQGQLRTSDDVRRIEVLDVTTGEPTTLAETVDGDRPVLVWFWAPH
jgi:ABC-type glycerol-3-phosphate transport system substrate-binding protein